MRPDFSQFNLVKLLNLIKSKNLQYMDRLHSSIRTLFKKHKKEYS